jgi:hypothetical protein
MVVWEMTIVVALVIAASTQLDIPIHILTHESLYQTKQYSSEFCKEHLCNECMDTSGICIWVLVIQRKHCKIHSIIIHIHILPATVQVKLSLCFNLAPCHEGILGEWIGG